MEFLPSSEPQGAKYVRHLTLALITKYLRASGVRSADVTMDYGREFRAKQYVVVHLLLKLALVEMISTRAPDLQDPRCQDGCVFLYNSDAASHRQDGINWRRQKMAAKLVLRSGDGRYKLKNCSTDQGDVAMRRQTFREEANSSGFIWCKNEFKLVDAEQVLVQNPRDGTMSKQIATTCQDFPLLVHYFRKKSTVARKRARSDLSALTGGTELGHVSASSSSSAASSLAAVESLLGGKLSATQFVQAVGKVAPPPPPTTTTTTTTATANCIMGPPVLWSPSPPQTTDMFHLLFATTRDGDDDDDDDDNDNDDDQHSIKQCALTPPLFVKRDCSDDDDDDDDDDNGGDELDIVAIKQERFDFDECGGGGGVGEMPVLTPSHFATAEQSYGALAAIVSYAPDSSGSGGGERMIMVCPELESNDSDDDVFAMFGERAIDARRIAGGVYEILVPELKPGVCFWWLVRKSRVKRQRVSPSSSSNGTQSSSSTMARFSETQPFYVLPSEDGMLSLELSNLRSLEPAIVMAKFAKTVRQIDLSGSVLSRLGSLDFLSALDQLQVLVLDRCGLTDSTQLPHLPQLRSLSCNNNAISSLRRFVGSLQHFRWLEYLSLLGNACCPFFRAEAFYYNYRVFVLSRLPHLMHLDCRPVSIEERRHAECVHEEHPDDDYYDQQSTSSGSSTSAAGGGISQSSVTSPNFFETESLFGSP
jgi:hypothetical protein